MFAAARQKEWGLPEALIAAAERFPDCSAVKSEDGQFTYLELLSHSLLVAERLKILGVKSGDRVAVCVNRDHYLSALLLGVGMLGAAYVPVDPAFPAERIAIILEDADVSAAIYEPSTQPLVGSTQNVLLLDRYDLNPPGDALRSFDELRSEYLRISERRTNTAELLAYIIFTSGSTGRPKGVPITHRAAINFLYGVDDKIGTQDGDRFLGLTTISFDISVLELFLPIVLGGCVYVCKKGDALSPDRLAAIIEDNRINVLQATPATWRLMLELGWKPNQDQKILCGGEAFPSDLAAKLLSSAGEVWNMYGPTEATVWVTSHKVSSEDIEAGFIPLGEPYANIELRVVNESLQPVCTGGSGELLIGGECLSPGYFRRPELNSDRFISLVENGQTKAFYRTGDLVEQRQNGRLRYLDRLDNQVKIRGFRIELGEIEAALQQIPGIADAAVVAVSNAVGDNVLVGCVRFAGEKLAFPVIEKDLRNTLPFYMTPGLWRVYESFPQTPNKKIDKKALKKDVEASLSTADGVEASFATDTELRLAKVWGAVLGAEPKSPYDHFNELGGHSLASARLSVEIEKEFGKFLSINLLIAHPLFMEQCELVASFSEDGNRLDESANNDRSLTDGQKRIWFICQLAGSSSVFNESEAFMLEGVWEVDQLKLAIDALMKATPAIRLHLNVDDLSWELREEPETPLEVRDLYWDSGALDAYLHQEAKREFNFSEELLVRFVAYEADGKLIAIQMITHHILLDGVSQLLVWNRLFDLYEQLIGGADFKAQPAVGWDGVNLARGGDDLRESVDFWRQELKGRLPALSLPTDYPRPEYFDFKGRQYSALLGEDVAKRLIAAAHLVRTRPFVILVCAYAAWLKRASGGEDIVLGTATSGRDSKAGLHDAIGMFFNTIPLRLYKQEKSLFEQVKYVEQTLNQALLHGELSFDKIVSAAHADRDPSRPTLAQAYITFNDFSQRKRAVKNAGALRPLHVDAGYTQGEIFLFVDFDGRDFTFRFQTSTALFTEQTSKFMISDFTHTLTNLIDSLEAGKSELKLEGQAGYIASKASPAEGFDPDKLATDLMVNEALLEKVIGVWKEVLELNSLDADANFFEVGGHSIKALQIFDQLHRKCGINAPLALLFKAPTPKSLAKELGRILVANDNAQEVDAYSPSQEGEGAHWRNIVTLSPGGAKTPLICVHPIGGNVLAYKALIDFEGLNRPVYGIQSTGLDGASKPFESILEMAAYYAVQVEQTFAKKHVCLLGGSMGGTIAIELANELLAKGFKVDWVILLDTIGPLAKNERESAEVDRRGFWEKAMQSFSARSKYYLQVAKLSLYRAFNLRLPQTLRIFDVRRANRIAMDRHHERTYGGSVILLRLPMEKAGAYSFPWLGWERHLTGRVEVETVDAEHAQFLESDEAKRVLAGFLREQE
ncbi:non-ribosomal peptide synthetase [Hahella sp. HN01]|uniref:non-ribosomal peptide synthetase n=1 Tax=Hahella sp. HN01 TaxID=2847262 RepID=UPI001C1ED62D|nr:non-ribosomal peptide synthetase [Hahella sp. HN01]MBU6950595.1 amino acid adenylation domain-containing protein [Hahella sp. HN01]